MLGLHPIRLSFVVFPPPSQSVHHHGPFPCRLVRHIGLPWSQGVCHTAGPPGVNCSRWFQRRRGLVQRAPRASDGPGTVSIRSAFGYGQGRGAGRTFDDGNRLLLRPGFGAVWARLQQQRRRRGANFYGEGGVRALSAPGDGSCVDGPVGHDRLLFASRPQLHETHAERWWMPRRSWLSN